METTQNTIQPGETAKLGSRYEDFLVKVRANQLTEIDIERTKKLKTISVEVEKSESLRLWIGMHGGIQYITTEDEARQYVSRLSLGSIVGIDIETAKTDGNHPLSGLHPGVSRIRTIQLWQEGLPAAVIDCFTAGYAWTEDLHHLQLAAHNAMFEIRHLSRVMDRPLAIRCTMLMMRPFAGRNLSLVNSMKAAGDMVAETEATEALNITLSKALQVSDWGREELLQEQIEYAAADSIAAAVLHDIMATVIAESDDSYSTVEQALQSLVPVIANHAPLQVDWEEHARLKQQWEVEAEQATQALADTGLTNPGSVKAKQAWLASMLTPDQQMDWPQTDSGNMSTAKDTISQYASRFPALAPLGRYTYTTSTLANVGQKLIDLSVDRALMSNYRIAGMVTGRFGSTEPNLQNIPKGMRHIFIAGPGRKFVTGDLSQIELRVAGLIAEESVINEAYAHAQDLHRKMGASMAGVMDDQVTKQQRQAAKAVNFGLLYGASAKTLMEYARTAYGVDMQYGEAAHAKESFHTTYPRLTEWQQEIVDQTNALGYSESKHWKLRRHYDWDTYTHAMNFPIQSTAWEILALAMIHIHSRLPDDNSIQISHSVYDELCLVADDSRVHDAALLLRDGFAHGFTTVFPDAPTLGLVGIGSGNNWAEAAHDDAVRKEWSL